MLEKKAADLQPGDKLVSNTGDIVTIRSVDLFGFSRGDMMVTYTNGWWSCLQKTANVPLAD